jgi:hypothetical protein
MKDSYKNSSSEENSSYLKVQNLNTAQNSKTLQTPNTPTVFQM